MRSLLQFLIKNSYWFVFIFLEVICFYFIFSGNSYQRSVFYNTSNELTGNVFSVGAEVRSYFGLRKENVELLQKNGDLLNRITALENRIFELEQDSVVTGTFLSSEYKEHDTYIAARVVNNSILLAHNYITLNKGANDGVEIGMGVVSHQGIVGEVREVSSNFSLVQSLLNADSRYSAKLLNSSIFGPIEWEGDNARFAVMKDYPSHELIVVGDSVVTSGYSDIFPRGVMIGKVHSFKPQMDGGQYRLMIELSTDFYSLSNVLVVKRGNLEEMKKLESSIHHVEN